MSEDIAVKVKQVIAEHLMLDVNQVQDSSNFVADLELDSLDAMDLLMMINESFHIHIPPEQLESILTVADMIKEVESHLSA